MCKVFALYFLYAIYGFLHFPLSYILKSVYFYTPFIQQITDNVKKGNDASLCGNFKLSVDGLRS
jgi:hypothetical protein